MTGPEHYAEAERLTEVAKGWHEDALQQHGLAASTTNNANHQCYLHGAKISTLRAEHAQAQAQVHATLALAASTVPRDTAPEPHSTAWCNARDAWDTVESGRRFDDLDPELQAALAARWQRTHG